MTIGQCLIYALAVVWVGAVCVWGVERTLARVHRRQVRTRLRRLVDADRDRELFAIVKGTDRLRAGYQTGHHFYGKD